MKSTSDEKASDSGQKSGEQNLNVNRLGISPYICTLNWYIGWRLLCIDECFKDTHCYKVSNTIEGWVQSLDWTGLDYY